MSKIKAIIFDLDDTLMDTTGLVKDKALKKAVKAMVKAGLKCSEDEGFIKIKEIIKNDPSSKKFLELAQYYNEDVEEISFIKEAGEEGYKDIEIEGIKPFSGVIETLEHISKEYKLALISTGKPEVQYKKIELLGIEKFFDHIFINQKDTKEECFLEAVEKLGIKANRIMGVGDRVDIDIKASNKLGLTSIQVMQGTYKDMVPKNELEKPDYKVKNICELPLILENIKMTENKLEKGPRIVVIGGGTGLPTLLEGLKHYTYNLTAIVTITDAGRSSGKLRKELNMLPPGDIRNNLIALSDSEKLMQDLLQYRFTEGSLEGHCFGNLFIAALTKITGNFETAIKEASKILDLKGGVYPSALEDTHICAELEDGTILKNEQEIVIKGDKIENDNVRAPIKRMFINPEDAKANPSAVERILDADVIVIGPGSLLTSVIPNLLVKDINKAIKESSAKKVYICNIVTQPGQTENFKASDHVKQIIKYLGEEMIDYVILNSQEPSRDLIESYKKEKAKVVENDVEKIKKLGVKPITEKLLEKIKEKKILWEKLYLLRHDSEKVAEIIINISNNEKDMSLKDPEE